MKFFFYFFFLIHLLSLAFTLETATKPEDKLENIAPIEDDEPSMPDNMIAPDFDDDHASLQDLDPNAQSNSIEPRKCVGRCRSNTNDCVWKCSDDWSRVVKPCHEYRPCRRDRRHCHVLANSNDWAICR